MVLAREAVEGERLFDLFLGPGDEVVAGFLDPAAVGDDELDAGKAMPPTGQAATPGRLSVRGRAGQRPPQRLYG